MGKHVQVKLNLSVIAASIMGTLAFTRLISMNWQSPLIKNLCAIGLVFFIIAYPLFLCLYYLRTPK